MANSKSAKKRVAQNHKKRMINLARSSAVKTAVKKVMTALEDNNVEQARMLFRDAEGKIARAASKGLMHRNTARRKISRLDKRIIEKSRAQQ